MKNIYRILFLLLILTSLMSGQYVNKWMSIGRLQSWYSEIGAEREHGFQAIQQYGMQWPAEYNYQDMQCAKGLWIGAKNFVEADGTPRNFKVVHVGPRVTGQDEFFPVSFEMKSSFLPSPVYVDGVESYAKFVEITEEDVDAELPFDRLLINEVNTQMGVTVKREIFQFSEEYHNDYIVIEYTFTNTGNIDDDEEIERPDMTLEDVMFYMQYRLSICREPRYLLGNSAGWGVNTMIDARGDGRFDDDNPDNLRFQYAWHGKYTAFNEWDNIGAPIFHPDEGWGSVIDDADTVGRLGAPQFAGILTLHADVSPDDQSDDVSQPSTTHYISSDSKLNYNNSAFNDSRMAEEYELMTKGHPIRRHAELIEPGGNYAEPQNDPSKGSQNGAGYSLANGYGPYTLKPGESVKIIIAEAVSGLGRDECIRVGKDYKDGVISAKEKNEAVMTGKDSLFQTFKRIKSDYNSGWNLSAAPLPPKDFYVTSSGGKVLLEWDVYSGSESTITGFEIYRTTTEPVIGYASNEYFSKYKLAAELASDARTFEDTAIALNTAYYYYIVSVGAEEPAVPALNIPAHKLRSGRFYAQTYAPATKKTPGAEKLTSDVRVVPNPYIISADPNNLLFPGEENKLAFVNLPGFCTIKIYSELGELIETLEHNDGSGAEYWFSTTASNQFVVSGLYIAVITDDRTGDREIVKFVVIR